MGIRIYNQDNISSYEITLMENSDNICLKKETHEEREIHKDKFISIIYAALEELFYNFGKKR